MKSKQLIGLHEDIKIVEKIDSIANERGLARSDLIREAIRLLLKEAHKE